MNMQMIDVEMQRIIQRKVYKVIGLLSLGITLLVTNVVVLMVFPATWSVILVAYVVNIFGITFLASMAGDISNYFGAVFASKLSMGLVISFFGLIESDPNISSGNFLPPLQALILMLDIIFYAWALVSAMENQIGKMFESTDEDELEEQAD